MDGMNGIVRAAVLAALSEFTPGDTRRRPYAYFGIVFSFLIGTAPSFAAETKAPTASVVSLAPSNTELLLNVGARKVLAGVCTNCPQVLPNADENLKNVPIVGTFVTANLERLIRVKPNAILLVSGQEAIAHMLKMKGFNVVLLKNDKLADIPENLHRVGALSKTERNADALSRKFNQALKDLSAIVNGANSKPKVFYCTWAQPLLTVGKNSFLNDIITTCGGANIAADMGQPYPHFSAERLILADPDVVILPYDAKDQALFKRFPWNKLRAVRESKLFYSPLPKDDMLSRPTMGVLDGLYWLTIKIHPELKPRLAKWRSSYCSMNVQ